MPDPWVPKVLHILRGPALILIGFHVLPCPVLDRPLIGRGACVFDCVVFQYVVDFHEPLLDCVVVHLHALLERLVDAWARLVLKFVFYGQERCVSDCFLVARACCPFDCVFDAFACCVSGGILDIVRASCEFDCVLDGRAGCRGLDPLSP